MTLREFYPIYLAEHSRSSTRRLHFIGTTLSIVCVLAGVATGNACWYLIALVQGYAWAWVGHFFFEHNRPATFKHPLKSFVCDWIMWFDMLRGRVGF